MTRSSDDPLISLGIDPGAGAVKIYGPAGGVQLPSLVATDGGRTLSRMAGLAQAKPPLHVSTRAGNFWLGSRAPDWGRLVENLDHERFTGSPEMQALLLGALTTYIGQYGPLTEPLEMTVGLPLEALTGSDEETQVTGSSVRRWLIGEQVWSADSQPYRVVVGEVKVSSQPAGALFDFLLDEAGSFIPARKLLFGKEIGVISVGLSTVELLAVRNGAPINRFTMGQTSGVRRLLGAGRAGRHLYHRRTRHAPAHRQARHHPGAADLGPRGHRPGRAALGPRRPTLRSGRGGRRWRAAPARGVCWPVSAARPTCRTIRSWPPRAACSR